MKRSAVRGELENKKRRWLSSSVACDEPSLEHTSSKYQQTVAGTHGTCAMGFSYPSVDDVGSLGINVESLLIEVTERMQAVHKQITTAKDVYEKVQRSCYANEGFLKAVLKLRGKLGNLEETLAGTVDDSARVKILCQIEVHKEQLADLEEDIGDENAQMLVSNAQVL